MDRLKLMVLLKPALLLQMVLDFVSFHNGDKVESNERKINKKDTQEDEALVKTSTTAGRSENSRSGEQEEKKVEGLVSKDTFFQYARSMGGWGIAIFLIFLFVLSQATSLACVAMIGRWSERSFEQQVRN